MANTKTLESHNFDGEAIQKLLAILPVRFSKKSQRILVLGDYPDQIIPLLQNQGCEVLWSEIEKETVGKRSEDSFESHQGSMYFDVGYEDGSIDMIFLRPALEQVPWTRWVLQEIQRLLKPEGILVVNRLPEEQESWACRLWRTIRNIFQFGFRTQSRFRPQPCRPSTWACTGMIESLGYSLIRSIRTQTNRRYCACKIQSDPGSLLQLHNDHRTQFLREIQPRLANRDQWLVRQPHFQDPHPVPLDVSKYSGRPVIILAPHPDDELIGCGGTILRLKEAGSSVTVVYLTDGSQCAALKGLSDPIRTTIRLEEARRVCVRLGISESQFWAEPDGNLAPNPTNIRTLSDTLGATNPAAVWIPFPQDPHPDHQATHTILVEALLASGLDLSCLDVFCYEVWSCVPANRYCVIDNEFFDKTRALMEYRTGMKVVNYIHFCEQLNQWESEILRGQPGYVEAFLMMNARQYVEISQ